MAPAELLACDRCGTFAPLSPAWDRQLCEACLARRHRVELEPFTVGALVSGAFGVASELGLPLYAWAAASGVARSAIAFAIDQVGPGLMKNAWLMIPVTASAHALTSNLMDAAAVPASLARIEMSAKVSWKAAWSQIGLRLPAVMVINLVLGLGGSIAALACVLPSFILLAWSVLAFPIVLREGTGPVAALRQSGARMRGHLRAATLAMLVLTLPLVVTTSIAGVIMNAAGPSPLSTIVKQVSELLMQVAWVPGMCLPAVAYAKLPKRLGAG